MDKPPPDDSGPRDPWEQPPEWVPLPDLPSWLERYLDLAGAADLLIPRVIDAIRFHDLIYEIQGLWQPAGHGFHPPSGFDWSDDHKRIVVTDWDAVEPKWREGTVVGPDRAGGAGNRYGIRVCWRLAASWASEPLSLREMRRRLGQSPPARPSALIRVPPQAIGTVAQEKREAECLERERQAARAAPTSLPAVAKRKHNGNDYRKADAPLIAEMRGLIEAKKARSAEDAARTVMKQAAGNGSEAAKVKRLAKHYHQTYQVQP